MNWNIRGLTKKLHQIEFRIHNYPGILHIIAIGEARLTAYNHPTFQLSGYRSTHNFRSITSGGGVTLFLHDSIMWHRAQAHV